jgi:hypothetical protein
VKIAGALPKEMEFVKEYCAYIPATSTAAESARALLAYVARPASRDIFKAAGVGMWGDPCGRSLAGHCTSGDADVHIYSLISGNPSIGAQ